MMLYDRQDEQDLEKALFFLKLYKQRKSVSSLPEKPKPQTAMRIVDERMDELPYE